MASSRKNTRLVWRHEKRAMPGLGYRVVNVRVEVPRADLRSLMSFIGERYIFTEKHYPSFNRLSAAGKVFFTVRHSQLHMSKSIGKIAAELEAADHGAVMSVDNLQVATAKMLVNVLKLAEELGMSAEELAAKIPEVMKNKK